MAPRRRLASALLGLLSALPGAQAYAAGTGENHILYVPSEEIGDAGLRRELRDFERNADSGQPLRSLTMVFGDAQAYPAADVHLAPLSPETQPLGREFFNSLRQTELLILRGGSFVEWYDRIYPPGPRSFLAAALAEFLESKKPIIAYGGACKFLSGGVLVHRKHQKEVQRNPRDTRLWIPRMAVGIGPYCLFDSDTWEAGSPLRLLHALRETGVDFGAHFVGEVAIDFDRSQNQMQVLGPGRVLIFNLLRARTGPGRIHKGRLTLLVAGDTWYSNESRAYPSPHKTLHKVRGTSPPGSGSPDWKGADPSGSQLAAWIENPGASALARQGTDARWTLGWDPRSRRARAEGARSSWLDLPFSCSWDKR